MAHCVPLGDRLSMIKMLSNREGFSMQDKRCILLEILELDNAEEVGEWECPLCGRPVGGRALPAHIDMCGRSLDDIGEIDPMEEVIQHGGLSEALHTLMDGFVKIKRTGSFGMSYLHLVSRRNAPRELFGGTALGASINTPSDVSEGCTGPLPWDVVCMIAEFSPEKFKASCKGIRRHVLFEEATKIAEVLLQKGARVDQNDDRGWTPLHHAAFSGNHYLCDLLLRHGAAVNAEGKGGTPLHLAAVTSSIDAAQTLLVNGADSTLPSHLGDTPLQTAKATPQPSLEFIALLTSHQ